MRLRALVILSASTVALMACASKTPPPVISYDSNSFKPAVETKEAPAQTTVAATMPEPVPGMLDPDPPAQKSDPRPPAERVEAANRAALQLPTSHGYMDAVQVYPFREGALYRLYAAQDQVADIALEPGETLSAVSAGDTVRWVVGDTTSGSGDSKRVHVLVKPFAPDLKTNLVITTDRRSYHLQLVSTEHTTMAMVSWNYPQDALLALQRKNAQAEAAAPVDSGLDLKNLQFRYVVTGDNPPWRPKRAFDDGSKVYIQFPDRIDQGEAPPLFVVGPNGDNQLVNYRVRDNYYIVDRLFAAAELRLGQKPQQVVRISRTDGVPPETKRADR